MGDESIELYNADSTVKYQISVKDPTIEGSGYVKAEVKSGKWIFYDGQDYPHTGRYQILDTVGEQPLIFSPKSGKSLPYREEALVLFAHPHFTGKEKVSMRKSDLLRLALSPWLITRSLITCAVPSFKMPDVFPQLNILCRKFPKTRDAGRARTTGRDWASRSTVVVL
jgi:hypothetical protein